MKSKNNSATKPIIFVTFRDGACEWRSFGWGLDTALMANARAAINIGETREEVVELLKHHFDVEELPGGFPIR